MILFVSFKGKQELLMTFRSETGRERWLIKVGGSHIHTHKNKNIFSGVFLFDRCICAEMQFPTFPAAFWVRFLKGDPSSVIGISCYVSTINENWKEPKSTCVESLTSIVKIKDNEERKSTISSLLAKCNVCFACLRCYEICDFSSLPSKFKIK